MAKTKNQSSNKKSGLQVKKGPRNTTSKAKKAGQKPAKTRGRFIVIDGIDGAGKATQTKLAVEALRKMGKKVETIDFPRYYNNFFGKLIGEALRGDYGDFLSIHPKIASILYGCDRHESAVQINTWLDDGRIVVADRFTSSNQIHQGAKCKTDAERKDFLEWLDKMEHEVLGVPRPDMIIYLNLPVAVSQQLLQKAKSGIEAKKKDFKKRYLKGGKDMAEENIEHMQQARESAHSIIKRKNNWKKIECFQKDALRTIEDIHKEVVKHAVSIL